MNCCPHIVHLQDDDGVFEFVQTLISLAEAMSSRGEAVNDDATEASNEYDCLRDVGGIAMSLQSAFAHLSMCIDRAFLRYNRLIGALLDCD